MSAADGTPIHADAEVAEMQDLVITARRAAYGDSNDDEIQSLQQALEKALTRWPEVDANPQVDPDA